MVKKKVSMKKTSKKSLNDNYYNKDLVNFDLIRDASDLIVILDSKGRFAFANDKITRFTGLKQEDVIGKPISFFSKVINPKSIPIMLKNFSRRIKGEEPLPYIIELKDLSGKYVPLEVTASQILKKSKVVGVMAILRDISEQKRAKEELRKKEITFKRLFESMNEGVAIHELVFKNGKPVNYKLLDVNPMYEKIISLKKKDVVGKLATKVYAVKKAPFLDIYSRVAITQKPEFFKTEYIPIGKQFHISVFSPEKDKFVTVFEDITDKEKSKIKLQEAEKRFRLAANISSDLIYEWNVIDNSLKWFGDIDASLGYKKGEFAHDMKNWVKNIHPEDQKKLKGSVRLHRTSKTIISEEYRIKTKDGSWRYWTDKGIPILDKKGKPLKWIGVCTDITNQKESVNLVIKEKEKLQSYFNLAGSMIVSLGFDGNIIRINKKACSFLGYEDKELMGKNWFNTCLPKENINEVKKVFKNLMAGKLQLAEHYNNSVITKKGKKRIISWHNAILRENDKITGILSSGNDITERLAAEKALDQNISLLKSTMESTADGILVVDLKGKPVFYNERFKILWNLSDKFLEDTDSKELNKFFLDKMENFKEQVSKFKELSSFPEEESFDILKLSDRRIFERNSIPQKIKNNIIGRVWSFRDITKGKQSEEEIRKRNLDLEKFNKLAVGRELKMIELKKKIRELESLLLKTKK